jgi:hypothetical protein
MKNLQTPAKRRMKAFDEPARKQIGRLASSFSLSEKSALAGRAGGTPACCNHHDERNPTGILTPGLNLTPVFPIHFRDQ